MKYAKDIVPMTEAELFAKLVELKKEHMNLRFQKKLDSINPSLINKVKKDIARINTRLAEIKNKQNKN
jgi:ribosomal protein L29